MSNRVIVAVVVAVVVLGVSTAVYFETTGDRGGALSQTEAADAAPSLPGVREALRPQGQAAVAAATPVAGDAKPAPLPADDDDQAAGKKSVRALFGRVVDGGLQPVAGVEIRLRVEALDSSGGFEIVRGLASVATTDAEGRFRFDDVRGAAGALARLSLRPSRHVDVDHGVTLADDGLDVDAGTITTKMGGTLRGLVVDADGRPIAGAAVRALPRGGGLGGLIPRLSAPGWEPRADLTGEDGHYEIEGVDAVSHTLMVTAADHAAGSSAPLTPVLGEVTEVPDIRLLRGGVIEGWIRSIDGTPLADVVVRIRPSTHRVELGVLVREQVTAGVASARTDADGRFRVAGLPPDAVNLTATKAGFQTGRRAEVPPDGPPIHIELAPAGMFVGRVVHGKSGAELQDFKVSAFRGQDRALGGDFRGASLEALTGSAAAEALGIDEAPANVFVVPDVPSNSIGFSVSKPGFGTLVVHSVNVVAGDYTEQIVALTPECIVAGRVVDDLGVAVALADVRVSPKVEDVDEMPFREGGVASVRRRVVTSTAEPAEEGVTRNVTTDAEGRFRIDGLREGDYVVRASHSDHCDSEAAPVALVSGESREDLKVVLQPGGTLEGRTFDADGELLPHARVTLEPVFEPVGSGRAMSANFGGREVRSSAAGNYEIRGLPPGEHIARVRAPNERDSGGMAFRIVTAGDGAKGDGVRVRINPRRETTQDLKLEPKGAISGRVREAGKLVAGVSIELHSASTGGFRIPGMGRQAVTNDRGEYHFDQVDAGEWVVSAQPRGAPIPFESTVAVPPKAAVVHDLDLPTGIIRGRVFDERRRPLSGVSVEALKAPAEGAEGPVRTARSIMVFSATTTSDADDGDAVTMSFDGRTRVATDAEGRFELRNLEDGKYDVSISGSNVEKQTKSAVVVEAGAETSGVDFEARRGAAIIVRSKAAEGSAGVALVQVFLKSLSDPGRGEEQQFMALGSTRRFEGLPPGRYELRSTLNELEYRTSVDLKEGESREVEVKFD